MARGISGVGVAVTVGGGVLLYSAIKDATISETLRSFLAGNPVATKTAGSGAGGPGSVPGNDNAPPNASGGSNFAATRDYLLGSLHFTKAGTAGALGNIQRESGFSTSVYGDGGTSGGLCQWHAGRFSGLQTYARLHNLDWRDIRAQLGWLHVELNSGYADVRLRMMSAGSPESAAAYWAARFEGCTDCHSGTAEMLARQQAARGYYNQL